MPQKGDKEYKARIEVEAESKSVEQLRKELAAAEEQAKKTGEAADKAGGAEGAEGIPDEEWRAWEERMALRNKDKQASEEALEAWLKERNALTDAFKAVNDKLSENIKLAARAAAAGAVTWQVAGRAVEWYIGKLERGQKALDEYLESQDRGAEEGKVSAEKLIATQQELIDSNEAYLKSLDDSLTYQDRRNAGIEKLISANERLKASELALAKAQIDLDVQDKKMTPEEGTRLKRELEREHEESTQTGQKRELEQELAELQRRSDAFETELQAARKQLADAEAAARREPKVSDAARRRHREAIADEFNATRRAEAAQRAFGNGQGAVGQEELEAANAEAAQARENTIAAEQAMRDELATQKAEADAKVQALEQRIAALQARLESTLAARGSVRADLAAQPINDRARANEMSAADVQAETEARRQQAQREEKENAEREKNEKEETAKEALARFAKEHEGAVPYTGKNITEDVALVLQQLSETYKQGGEGPGDVAGAAQKIASKMKELTTYLAQNNQEKRDIYAALKKMEDELEAVVVKQREEAQNRRPR